jgi:hypothetical protein
MGGRIWTFSWWENEMLKYTLLWSWNIPYSLAALILLSTLFLFLHSASGKIYTKRFLFCSFICFVCISIQKWIFRSSLSVREMTITQIHDKSLLEWWNSRWTWLYPLFSVYEVESRCYSYAMAWFCRIEDA